MLYALYDDGVFQKYGITSAQPPKSRYCPGDKEYDMDMIILGGGSRSDMLDLEREFVSRDGGPLNLEPWSSFIGPRQP